MTEAGQAIDVLEEENKRISAELEQSQAREEMCCGMNPEGVADLEMRFGLLMKDYKALHSALSKMAQTHSKPLIHDALKAVNPCWTLSAGDKESDEPCSHPDAHENFGKHLIYTQASAETASCGPMIWKWLLSSVTRK